MAVIIVRYPNNTKPFGQNTYIFKYVNSVHVYYYMKKIYLIYVFEKKIAFQNSL